MPKYARFLFIIVMLLPLLISRDVTPDNELKYLSIAEEAINNGNVFAFTNHGVPYADKPPLYIWFMMTVRLVFGQYTIGILQLFSLVPALIILFIMSRWVRNETTERQRSIGDWLLISTGLFLGSAIVLRMDMLMTMFITLALYEFYKIWKGSPGRYSQFLFGLYVFLAIFSKGAVGLLVPLVATTVFLAWNRQLREWTLYWGWRCWVVILPLCALWFTGVYVDGGSSYLNNLLFHQTINRAVDSFHHKEPIWFYSTTIWYAMAPWSLLYIGVIVVAAFKRLINTPMERFFVTVGVSTFVMLSLVSSKIDVYLLPAYPFICYTALLLLPKLHNVWWVKMLIAVPAIIFILLLPVLYLYPMGDISMLSTPYPYILAAVLCLGGVMSLIFLLNNRVFKAIESIAIALLVSIFATSTGIRELNPEIGLRNIAVIADELSKENAGLPIFTYRIRCGDNADIYINKQVRALREGELDSLKSGVLIFRNRDIARDQELSERLASHSPMQIGSNSIIVIK